MKLFNHANRNWVNRNVLMSLCLILLLGVLSACGGAKPAATSPTTKPADSTAPAAPAATAAAPAAAPKELLKTTLILNWFAEPEHGGNFAALVKGYYKDAGFDMTLMPGGPQVSATQIVASGKAQFGMANGDDILVARQEGIPIVAIATSMQKSPQALFFHKEDTSIKDFADLNGHKVYVASTASYWQFIKKKYKLDNAQEMKYTGQLVNFVSDPKAVTQGYVTSEPFSLKQQNVDIGTLLVADSGYGIYAGVYFTTEKMIAEHPDQVKAFVEATVKGWDYYKDHSEEIHPAIKEKNPDMGLDMMKFSAQQEMDFVYGGDAATKGTGVMTKERWAEVQKQLVEVGVLKKEEDISKVFTDQFLPKK